MSRRPWWLLLPTALLLGACSVVHISTPFYSTTSRPSLPAPIDHRFLDEVAKAAPSMSGEVERVRAEMVDKAEDRYWASEQLLIAAAEQDPILASLVEVDNDFYKKLPYVSAKACAECHPKHFDEWSVSPHAYAQLSPVFNAMHGAIGKLTGGSNGDFCIRCHTQVGMNMDEPLFVPNAKRNLTSREGITCVVCHRIGLGADFGKVSGRLPFERPDPDKAGQSIHDPVRGPTDGRILAQAIEGPPPLADQPGESGQRVHGKVSTYPLIKQPAFCGMCHDVTLGNTFRLEEAFSDYKLSPAAQKGISCQDCHMGKVPGQPEGYDVGPAAIVAGKPTPSRRLTNHMIAGPDYSLIHPGLFPHLPAAYGNPDNQVESPFFAELTPGRWKVVAGKYERIPVWMDFDYQGDWGKPGFEEGLEQLSAQIEELGFSLEEAEGPEDQARIKGEIAALQARFPDFKSWGGTAPADPEAIPQWLENGSKVRKQARRLLEDRQYRLLAEYRKQQEAVLRAGYRLKNREQAEGAPAAPGEDPDIRIERLGPDGFDMTVVFENATEGHSAPVGFDAERSVFMQVGVVDADGQFVFASGDLDPNGDIRDLHSTFVHGAEPGTVQPLWWMPLDLPEPQPADPWREPTGHIERASDALGLDPFLFSLQSKFIVRLNRGGEREQVLAVNQSINPIPFIRPPVRSNILTGKPLPARTQRRGVEPLGTRTVRYSAGPFEGHRGPFTVRIRIVTGMVPVNLIDAIKFVGFDYGYSARELARTLVNGFTTEVPYPTAIGPRGLPELVGPGEASDEELALGKKALRGERVREKITGRQILWEYEVRQDAPQQPLRIIPPPAGQQPDEGVGDPGQDQDQGR